MKTLALAAMLLAATPALTTPAIASDDPERELTTASTCRMTFAILLNLHAATAATLATSQSENQEYNEHTKKISAVNYKVAAYIDTLAASVEETIKARIAEMSKTNETFDEDHFSKIIDRVFKTVDADAVRAVSTIVLNPSKSQPMIRELHKQADACVKWLNGQ